MTDIAKNVYTFKFERIGKEFLSDKRYSDETVTFKFSGDYSIDEMLEQFVYFLKACTFEIETTEIKYNKNFDL